MWRVLALLLGLEALIGMSWWLFLLGKSPGHLHYAVATVAAQAMALLAFLCGGRAEQQHAWLTRLNHRLRPKLLTYNDLEIRGALIANSHTRPSEAVHPDSSEATRAWRDVTRHRLMSGLYASAFAIGERCPAARIARQITLPGGLVRTLLTFDAIDGTTIPAFLLRPRTARQAPAVLVIPGHGRGIIETAGMVPSYQHGSALALARAGFIVLSPELRGFGYLEERLHADHIQLAREALRNGTSYHALVIEDLRLALTLLLNDVDVDARRVAVTGCSLGGDLSLTLGALDLRVAAVVAQGLCSWRGAPGTRPSAEEDGSAFSHDMCSLIPGEAAVARYEDRFLLMCPRPFAIFNGRRDVGKMREDESWLLSLLRRTYRLEDASERFDFELLSGGHEYYVGPAIRFLRRHFRLLEERPEVNADGGIDTARQAAEQSRLGDTIAPA